MTFTCALNWSKLAWGAKTAKWTILRGLVVIYFVRGQNRQIVILRRPKLLLRQRKTQ